MAPNLPSIIVLALYVVLSPCISGDNCLNYTDRSSCSSTQSFQYSSNPYFPSVIAYTSIFYLMFFSLCVVCWCCACPCCYLHKRFHKPHPVMATATHSTEASTIPQQYPQRYPQQLTAVPGPSQSYQGVPFQPVPVLPGYPAQPIPTSPNHGQPFTPEPPPSYQEATSSAYPLQLMHYSQAAFTPDPSRVPFDTFDPDSA